MNLPILLLHLFYTALNSHSVLSTNLDQQTMFSCFRKSLFVPQNEKLSLLQIFKPVYMLLASVGLFPSAIEFPSENRDNIVVLQHSSINLAPTILIATATCGFFCLHGQELSVASKDNYLTKDTITLANYVANLAFTLLVVIVIYISAFKNRRSYVNILKSIAGCWMHLPIKIRGDVILEALRDQVNYTVLGSLLLMLITQLTITFTESDPPYKIALITMTFNLPEMIQFTLLAFYFVMILLIVALLKNIEEQLAMLAHLRMVNGMEKDYLGLKMGSSLESLRMMRNVYARAMAAKRQVNAAFQAPLLFILAQNFHGLVADAHGIYHIILKDDFSTHNIIEECFWVFYHLIKFHIIGYSSVLLKLQVGISIR